LVRLFPDGILQKAKMKPGSQGFCEAFFDEEGPINTELPNIMLQPIQKRPAGRMRPAAAVAAESSQEQDGEDEQPDAGHPVMPLAEEQSSALVHQVGEEAAPLALVAAGAEGPPASSPTLRNVGNRYQKLYYKNFQSYGIRQKFGSKKQIFSLRSRNMSHEELESLAEAVLSRLNGGMDEETAQDWARQHLR